MVGLSSQVAGSCLLSGQLADGIMTPIVGLASDKVNTRCGKRTPWYFFGSFFVLPTFAGIFMYPNFINDPTVTSENMKNLWYITLPALFNVGWASVQISHMSIVNQLSYSVNKKDQLVNNRNGFTYAANIVVLSGALRVFLAFDNPIDQFRILCAMCLIFGCCSTGFYMLNIREVKLSEEAKYLDKLYKKQLQGEQQILTAEDSE